MIGRSAPSIQGSSRLKPAALVALALLLAGLAAASSAAAVWDRWPGDGQGVRATQGSLNALTEPLMRMTTVLGSVIGQVTLTAVAGAWLLYIRQRRLATVLVLVVLIQSALVWLLKWVVDRPRPELPSDLQMLSTPSGQSFPSGHVAFEVLFFGALVYLLARHWRGAPWLRRVLVGLFLMPLALVGPARVAWGIHWPSDVLGGYLVALLGIVLLAVFLGHYGDEGEQKSFSV